MANKVIQFAEDHPIWVGVGVVAVGLLMLMMLGGKGGGNDQTSASAYYAAESADTQAGDAVQIAQINAQAGTAQTIANDAANVTINSTWAGTDLAQTQANDNAQIALAPFAVESQAVGALSGAASQGPLTVETQSHSNGFFGLFGGSKASTSQVANPVAVGAVNELDAIIASFGH